MPKVAAFTIDGIRCWFWSADHDPPHFHAERDGEWEVRVEFLELPEQMLTVVWAEKPMSKKHRKRLLALAEIFRDELLEQWQDIREEPNG